jgi:hypothetical protein
MRITKLNGTRERAYYDVASSLKLKLDRATEILISGLCREDIPRGVRRLARAGKLEPFLGEIEEGYALRYIENLLYLVPIETLAKLTPPNFTPHKPESAFIIRQREIASKKERRVSGMLVDNFRQPKVHLLQVRFIPEIEDPSLELERGWRSTLNATLSIHHRWQKAFSYSNENYLVAMIHSPEHLTDGVTVWKAKGWAKKAIRTGGIPDLIDIVVACTGEVHTATLSRATALRGLTIRTKNRVIGQVWDL